MSNRVTMPALGESVTEGTVTRWLKQVGDQVAVDEPLLEVSTDKVDTEIPSPFAGTLQEILVAEDETAAVGADLAVIGDGPAAGGAGSGDAQAEAAPAGHEQPAEQTTDEQAQTEAVPSAEAEIDEQTAESGPTPAPEPQPSAAAPAPGGGGGGGQAVTMPALGESVTEGTVTRWLKQIGQTQEISPTFKKRE
ncbi:MAG TPA: 2-oxoglutarate dehydrogenase, E2 component, dihydrolipoamide succinyltransferase, partial [Dermatophilaceae bacterium]|nr:2-oxoglutarate dehydrogenase, E2 component, dihydrolipoamide succinyltransferase [Dermatophilaceae bacterium]